MPQRARSLHLLLLLRGAASLNPESANTNHQRLLLWLDLFQDRRLPRRPVLDAPGEGISKVDRWLMPHNARLCFDSLGMCAEDFVLLCH